MSENGAITWTNERRRLRDLVPWDHNPREINKSEAERLGVSRKKFGQVLLLAIGPNNEIYDGHQRKLVWSILPEYGPDHEVEVRVSSRELTEQERKQLVIYLHRGTNAGWDWEELANSFELDDLLDWGFSEGELIGDWGEEPEQEARATLAERFLVPPFSVLDARQGYWQDRKRAWIALGIESELGRGENASQARSLLDFSAQVNMAHSGTKYEDTPRNIPGQSQRERVAPKMAMHNDPMQRKRKYAQEADGRGCSDRT
jgi:hypothetical protein